MSEWKKKRAKMFKCPEKMGEYSFMSEWKNVKK